MAASFDFSLLLIKRIKNRDTTALDYLYDHYADALYGIIHRTLQNDELAEETLHDVLLKIWNQIDQYDSKKGTLFTWMYRLARNRAIDVRRSRDFKVQQKSNDLSNFVNIFESTDTNQEDHIGLHEVIKKTGEQCRKLIQLNFFMGYSHGEISKNEKIPLGTVKTKLRKCLKAIREQLDEK